jgi:arsenate reductase (thioredoxin)
MNKTRVLFLCTGNRARSQMAEGILKQFGGDNFEVHSAGLAPDAIYPQTKQVMSKISIDINDQHPKGVQTYLGKAFFDYVIIVCQQAEEKCPSVFPGTGQKLSWPFEDPGTYVGSEAETLAKFREVRDKIKERILTWLTELGVSAAVST